VSGRIESFRARLTARAGKSHAPAVSGTLRALGAFAIAGGLAPASRTRALSACCEILDNACRHGLGDRAECTVEVRATLAGRELRVAIRDDGRGFDQRAALLADARGPAGGAHAQGGLARAAALSEALRVESDAHGTEVTLAFATGGAAFDEHGLDLSDRDWLDPTTARELLRALDGGADPAELVLSPAMAVTVGRLLAGRTPDQELNQALWS
jgi:anti-sigma regulatory factor (Ser/Thr protein kinase)